MSIELYYTAPSDEIFKEVQEAAISIWSNYDDTYGYASGKMNHVKGLENLKDNFMHIVAMFDWKNNQKLLGMVSQEARDAIRERIEDGQS